MNKIQEQVKRLEDYKMSEALRIQAQRGVRQIFNRFHDEKGGMCALEAIYSFFGHDQILINRITQGYYYNKHNIFNFFSIITANDVGMSFEQIADELEKRGL